MGSQFTEGVKRGCCKMDTGSLDICKKAEVPVQISHLRVVGNLTDKNELQLS
jgi:hypothetical protein